MGCSKRLVGTITLDHDRKKEYSPLIKEIKTIALRRGAVGFNGAILTLDIDEEMSCGEAMRLDEIIVATGKFAVEAAEVRTVCDDEMWYIYVGPPEGVRRLKTEQACCALGGIVAGIGNNPDLDLVAIRHKLQDLAGSLAEAGLPDDRDPNNEDRAGWAREVIAAGVYGPDPSEESIGDLIADLLHLAREEGYDSLEVLHTAQNNFDCEERE